MTKEEKRNDKRARRIACKTGHRIGKVRQNAQGWRIPPAYYLADENVAVRDYGMSAEQVIEYCQGKT